MRVTQNDRQTYERSPWCVAVRSAFLMLGIRISVDQ